MRVLVNTKKAAEILGVEKNTLEGWRCHNRGPKYVKIGRRVLYDLADLDAFIASCTVPTSDMPPVTLTIRREEKDR